MTNNTLVVTNARTEVLQEVQHKTIYLEARSTNTLPVGVANRDMPYVSMKFLSPGQWFAISCEFSERLYFKAPTGATQTIEWWYED
jgi:hypothetical protein